MDLTLNLTAEQQSSLKTAPSAELKALQDALKSLTIERLPVTLQSIKIAQTVEITVQRLATITADELAKLIAAQKPVAPAPLSSKPLPTAPAPTLDSFIKITLATPNGPLEVIAPKPVAPLFPTGSKYTLTLEPGTPPVFSKIQLLNTPLAPKTGATALTPIVQNPSINTGLLPAIKTGGIIEAFILPALKGNAGQTQPSTQAQLPAVFKPFSLPVTQSQAGQINGLNLPRDGFVVGLKISSVTPPQSNQAQAPQGQSTSLPTPISTAAQTTNTAPVFQGQVIGFTASKAPIVQTTIATGGQTYSGPLLVLTGTPLDEGTLLSFELIKPTPASSPARAEKSVLPLLTQNWDSLMDMLNTLQTTAPEAALQLRASMPQPTANLPSVLKFFLTAMQVGDGNPAAWLGQPIMQHTREARLQNLINSLGTELKAHKSTRIEQRSGQEFRGYTLPFMNEQQIQPIEILVRHAHQGQDGEAEKKQDKAAKNVRFLVNLNMSRLGPVQLDGMLKNTLMNMIVRLENQLPAPLQKEMIGRYADVLETLGLKGSLSFQGKDTWVKFVDQRHAKPQIAEA